MFRNQATSYCTCMASYCNCMEATVTAYRMPIALRLLLLLLNTGPKLNIHPTVHCLLHCEMNLYIKFMYGLIENINLVKVSYFISTAQQGSLTKLTEISFVALIWSSNCCTSLRVAVISAATVISLRSTTSSGI